jgi:hypothetical protein
MTTLKKAIRSNARKGCQEMKYRPAPTLDRASTSPGHSCFWGDRETVENSQCIRDYTWPMGHAGLAQLEAGRAHAFGDGANTAWK